MLCFEVSVNGQKKYTAGHANVTNLQTAVTYTLHVVEPHVFSNATIRYPHKRVGHIQWARLSLNVGDEVSIKLINAEAATPPTDIVSDGTSVHSEAHHEGKTCSFCGRSQEQVLWLVAHPSANVCEECVRLLADIIDQEKQLSAKKSTDGS